MKNLLIAVRNYFAIVLAALVCTAGQAFAQTGGASPTDTGASIASAPSLATPPTKKELKAQRKAQRKQARVAKDAELKQLENAGYQPAQGTENYPANLQNSEKAVGEK